MHACRKLTLLAALDELAVTGADAEALVRLAVAGESVLGLDPEGVVAFAGEAGRLGFDPCALVHWVVSVIRRHGRLDGELERRHRELETVMSDVLERKAEAELHARRVARLLDVLGRAGRGDWPLRDALCVSDDELGAEAIAQAVAWVERELGRST